MKKRNAILAVLLIAGTQLFAAISNPAATVNLTKTTVISTDELHAKLKQYQDALAASGQDPTQVNATLILDAMVNDELVRQGASRAGIKVTEAEIDQAFNQLAAQNNMTVDQFRKAVLANYPSLSTYRDSLKTQISLQKYLYQEEGDILGRPIKVTDSEVQNLYRRSKSQLVMPENVKISHIFIPFADKSEEDAKNKSTMESVAQQLKSGKLSFEQAVTQYSKDEDSRDRAGDIGWLTYDNTGAATALGDDFMDAAFSTEVGGTSDLVISNQGYHIIKILAHNDVKMLGLDDKMGPDSPTTVRDYLSYQLQSQKQQELLLEAQNALIDTLKKQATIKILYK